MKPAAASAGMRNVGCAIYTRKSSEEGLEQDFNSLDAQREACSAYILSQASEGWVATGGLYDDGGLSGGTLERPALKRLLADVAAGAIDIIVVYKVDRLTRSLLDFSRLVEAFDKADTSFVSVTQSFNTTTSMGRLTLNMLLSFAQFEREVTAERIRDKIAASKAQGMWMGGVPPLGYRPNGRSLTVVDDHAALVRRIYARYLVLGNVRLLAAELTAEGHLSPVRTTSTGRTMGGVPFSRGQLYLILRNRTYLGEIAHRDAVYPGLHDAILERDLWDEVQARLDDNRQGKAERRHVRNPSLLAGLVVDAAGTPLIAVHAGKAGPDGGIVRYRYYVSPSLQQRPATDNASSSNIAAAGLRIPAREIEAAVAERIAQAFDDPVALIAAAWLDVPAHDYGDMTCRAAALAAQLRLRNPAACRELVTQVRVEQGHIAITCSLAAIAAALGTALHVDAPESMTLSSDVRLTRSGRAMRLVHASGTTAGQQADRSLVRLVAQAHRWWRELRKGELNVLALAAREGVSQAWISRVLRLAFLAPDVVEAILTGRQRAGVDGAMLLATDAVPANWSVQRVALLPERLKHIAPAGT